jgi:hypothetical protein
VKKPSKHKRITADGKVWYYYPKKKKVGRKKKRGPKKKKKETWVRRVFPPWNFRIILCGNKEQIKKIGRYHDELEVSEAKEKLIQENNKILIPVLHKNNSTNKTITEWDLEYIVIKKVTEDDVTNVTKLPNKYGKYVDHTTNSEEWLIWDKFPCKIEEVFWVYGYDNVSDKKDVTWIYENLIESKIEYSYDIIRVCLYNNKLILQDDSKNIDIIICKNKRDGIILYNCLREHFCPKNKNTLFTGLLRRGSEKQKDIIELIKKKTGWTYQDIYRSSTRH